MRCAGSSRTHGGSGEAPRPSRCRCTRALTSERATRSNTCQRAVRSAVAHRMSHTSSSLSLRAPEIRYRPHAEKDTCNSAAMQQRSDATAQRCNSAWHLRHAASVAREHIEHLHQPSSRTVPYSAMYMLMTHSDRTIHTQHAHTRTYMHARAAHLSRPLQAERHLQRCRIRSARCGGTLPSSNAAARSSAQRMASGVRSDRTSPWR
jgi:hypothetical protein